MDLDAPRLPLNGCTGDCVHVQFFKQIHPVGMDKKSSKRRSEQRGRTRESVRDGSSSFPPKRDSLASPLAPCLAVHWHCEGGGGGSEEEEGGRLQAPIIRDLSGRRANRRRVARITWTCFVQRKNDKMYQCEQGGKGSGNRVCHHVVQRLFIAIHLLSLASCPSFFSPIPVLFLFPPLSPHLPIFLYTVRVCVCVCPFLSSHPIPVLPSSPCFRPVGQTAPISARMALAAAFPGRKGGEGTLLNLILALRLCTVPSDDGGGGGGTELRSFPPPHRNLLGGKNGTDGWIKRGTCGEKEGDGIEGGEGRRDEEGDGDSPFGSVRRGSKHAQSPRI